MGENAPDCVDLMQQDGEILEWGTLSEAKGREDGGKDSMKRDQERDSFGMK